MKYDLIAFDFDDTLINSFNTAVTLNIKTAEYMNIRVPKRSEFFKILGMPWTDMVEKVWPGLKFEEFMQAYNQFRHLDVRTKIDGVDETLLKLKDIYDMGIVTSRSRKSFEGILTYLTLPDCFKFMQTIDESKYTKPDGRVFNTVIEKYGKNILYLGDSPVDAHAAKEAGIDFIGILREGMTPKDFYDIGAKTVLKSVVELPKYLGLEK